MKVVKTYVLSEKSLEKDIDKFIVEAKKGKYQYDHRYGGEGLKILKAYFRFIEKEVKSNNFKEAVIAYDKLFQLLFQKKYEYFNYEDIIGKFNMEKIVRNYFYSLININEKFFENYINFLRLTEEYYFENTNKTILEEMNSNKLDKFIQEVEEKLEKLNIKEDYYATELIELLLEYYKINDSEKFLKLKDKYKDVFGENI